MKLKKILLAAVIVLLMSALPGIVSAQSYYLNVDSLTSSSLSKTHIFSQRYELSTVTVRNTSSSADTVFAYNISPSKSDTTQISVVRVSDKSEFDRMIIPANSSYSFFLWDPIIDYLHLRKNSNSAKSLIITTKAVKY